LKNNVQLVTYVDRLSGVGLRESQAPLSGPLEGAFGGVHLLAFFCPVDGAGADSDPIDRTLIDPRLGEWGDLSTLGCILELMAANPAAPVLLDRGAEQL
jgi:sucrose phosphorylase